MDQAACEAQLRAVIDRKIDCDTFAALAKSLRPSTSDCLLKECAIGLDANALLRIANHPRSEDIIDYFTGRHVAPLVVPGQAIQEYWNSQLQAIDPIAVTLKKKFDEFKAALQKINGSFGEYVSKIDAMLNEFSSEYGHVYDENVTRKRIAMIEALSSKATVCYVKRSCFWDFALHRRMTKTPPGFLDSGDGDFFIWMDFLCGLLLCRNRGVDFKKVVLISLDKKADWSRAGAVHPILVAEVQALFSVAFEIWTIDKLADEVAAAT